MDDAELLDRLSARGARRAELAAATTENDGVLHDLILTALEQDVSIAEIARRTGYHRNAVRDIRRRAGRE